MDVFNLETNKRIFFDYADGPDVIITMFTKNFIRTKRGLLRVRIRNFPDFLGVSLFFFLLSDGQVCL